MTEGITDTSPLDSGAAIVEKSIHGHVHDDETFMTYPPLREILKLTFGERRERDYWLAEIKQLGFSSRIYYRYVPELKLLMLDWIYIPKSLRRRCISRRLLTKMVEHFPEAERVHLLLSHGNLRAFEEGAERSLDEKTKSAPTIRELTRLGFVSIEYLKIVSFPRDHRLYPEVVMSRAPISQRPSIDS
jgi:hypothetical protein